MAIKIKFLMSEMFCISEHQGKSYFPGSKNFNQFFGPKNPMVFLVFGIFLLMISSASALCAENWQCLDWQKCSDGVSERTCFEVNGCFTYVYQPAESAECKDALPYCYDGILNQDETDVDCGGKSCEACDLGKNCFRNEDCKLGVCISTECSFEGVTVQPAIQSERLSWFLAILITLLSAAIVYLLRTIMKKLKRQRILAPSIKERIKISIPMSKKKSRFDRFADNVNGYLNSMKSEKAAKKDNPKGLLNKNSFKKQEHPVKDFMLDNLKEAYNE